MMILVILVVILLACLYLLDYQLKRMLNVKLIEHIPCPKGYPIIGNMLEFTYHGPDELFIFLRKMARKYPKIYRLRVLTRSVVCIFEPDDIEALLSSMKHIQKSVLYDYLHPWLKDGLLTSFGNKWQNRRKILTPAFHFNILQQFVTVIEEHGKQLVENLQLECNNKETIITPIITDFALNSLCETAMGTNLSTIAGADVYKNAIHRMGHLLIYRIVRPWLLPNILFNMTSKGREQESVLEELHSFTKTVISDRKRNYVKVKQVSSDEVEVVTKSNKRLAMLDLLLSAQANGQIDENGIREEVDTFMFEGHDTSSMGMVFGLLCLANNPDVQDKVYKELIDIFETSDRSANIQDLNQMRYLEQCLKESLRLYPSVPFISRFLTQPLKLANYTIPAGQIVHVHIFDIHRNPTLYPDPEKYDPDRFLPENCANRHPFAYIPFSAGPRNCIGQKFAMLEMKSIISQILRNYKLEAVTKPEDMVFHADLLLRPRDPVKIKFILR